MTDAQTLFSFKFLQKTNQVTLTSPKKCVFIVTNARNANRVNRIKSSKGGNLLCLSGQWRWSHWVVRWDHPSCVCVCVVFTPFSSSHTHWEMFGEKNKTRLLSRLVLPHTPSLSSSSPQSNCLEMLSNSPYLVCLLCVTRVSNDLDFLFAFLSSVRTHILSTFNSPH